MDPRTRAGRQAALLLGIGGARALLAMAVGPDGQDGEYLLLGVAALALAATIARVPWQRLPAWSSLPLVVPGFGMVSATESLGLVPARASGVAFVLVFAWVGANHRRWTSPALLPLAGLAYALPTATAAEGLDVRALLLTLAVCVLVAEIIAHSRSVAADNQQRAEQATHAFRVVARASAGLHHLDPDRVLDSVADAVLDLGYDGANLAVRDQVRNTFHPTHGRGIATGFAGTTLQHSEGVTGEVYRTSRPVVVADYPSSDFAVPVIAAAGVRSVIAVPVFRGRDVVAVLYAMSRAVRQATDEEVEVMRILSATAGTALDNAEEFLAQQRVAQRHATAALIDPLTGVGNRRYAEQLLSGLRTGDSLVMIDLDGFKDINDRLGHAAGDRVLRELADHLVGSLREVDCVARFGGEEFLVVLSRLDPAHGEDTVHRLLQTWRERHPATTFSAGIAHHGPLAAEVTLDQADQALYAAKAAGRDTWRTYASTSVVPPRAESGIRPA